MGYLRPMLYLEGIGKTKDGQRILQDIHFSQQPFAHIAIAGETGSGKSTLLKIIAGLVQPDEGQALLNGEKIKGPDDQLVPGHKGVAYLSQHFELRNNYWVHEILSYANRLGEEEAGRIYKICRIDHLLQRRTHELSGGEKQRIATARLLINDPVLLLLDEPFSNLDMIHRQLMKEVIRDITDHLKITMILVSHEPADILPWADQLMLMKAGRVVQQGPPREVYAHPKDLYCAGLLGQYNLLSAETAAAITGATDPAWQGRQLMIRPEDLKLGTGGNGLKATVRASSFFGSHDLCSVDTAAGSLLVSVPSPGYAKGTALTVSAAAGSVWPL